MRGIIVLLSFLLTGCFSGLTAQEYGGYHFGVKGGLTVGQQDWNGFERDPLIGYHGAAFIESIPVEGRFSLLAQLGYHLKGSSLRQRNLTNTINGQVFRAPAETFEFYNLSLIGAARQVFTELGATRAYYLLGLRLDYTLDTNLDKYNDLSNDENTALLRAYYPLEDNAFLRRVNYGVSVGGGFEFPFSEYVGMLLEFSVHPDFSLQYQQPQIENVPSPFSVSRTVTLPERRIRNLTFEVSLGFRFLRRIEYID
jgi:hypothetical protein